MVSIIYRHYRLLVLLAPCLLWIFSACSQTPVQPEPIFGEASNVKPWTEQLTVVVQDRYSGQARPGIKVALMNAQTNQLCVLPAISDPNGRATFPDLPTGHYAVVVFPGDQYGVYNLPGSFHLPPESDEKWPIGLVTGHSYPPTDPSPGPMPVRAFYVQTYDRSQPGGLPRIQGTIVDAATGDPIGGAFVSLTPGFSAYLGQVDVWDDVTLADGLFSVSDIPFMQDQQSGNIFQVIPLTIMGEGYWPRPYLHQLASGDDNVDITDVLIEMSPEDDSGSGTLTGQLVADGEPVPDVVVGLCYYGPVPGLNAQGRTPSLPEPEFPVRSDTKSSVGMPGTFARTDENGFFRFDGLVPGGYFPYPAYRSDSDYQLHDAENNYIRTIEAGQTVAMGQLSLVRTIRQIWPAPAAILGAPVFSFAWTMIESAADYLVFLDSELVGSSENGYFELPAGEEVMTGHHSWAILARDAQGVTTGLTKRLAFFTVQ